MCTAVNDNTLFGRTLDMEFSYGEKVIIAGRKFPFNFINKGTVSSHPAIIGIACEAEGVPLYYDAINEYGLGVAGLNFPNNAVYNSVVNTKTNIASFEVIPWILCNCKTLLEARELLQNVNITNQNFSSIYTATPLHWIVADSRGSITLESTAEGINIYENPVGVLTNNPPFPYHLAHITEYMHLNSVTPQNTLCSNLNIQAYSGGFGAIGLPGDYSSASRFVRAVFAKNHTTHSDTNKGEVNRFFHIMDTVSVPKGCVKTTEGKDWLTIYTSCANRDELCYYFTTYECRSIKSVSLTQNYIDSNQLYAVPINTDAF